MTYTGQPVPSTTYQQAKAKMSDGKSVRVTVPENSDLKAGQLVYLDGFLGFLMRDVLTAGGETAEGILNIEQAEFESDKIDNTKAFNKGDKAYWDADNSRLTTDVTSVYAGTVTVAKDSNDVVWFRLEPGFVVDTALQVIGDLEDLETSESSSLVKAVNEINTAAGTALARTAANVACDAEADAEAVRAALIALLDALETAGLMESGE